MGTKRNPGKFDCHSKAGVDEPMFILLGRDPQAAQLVRNWAVARRAAGEDAMAQEAMECADAMERFCNNKNKAPDGGARQPSLIHHRHDCAQLRGSKSCTCYALDVEMEIAAGAGAAK